MTVDDQATPEPLKRLGHESRQGRMVWIVELNDPPGTVVVREDPHASAISSVVGEGALADRRHRLVCVVDESLGIEHEPREAVHEHRSAQFPHPRGWGNWADRC